MPAPVSDPLILDIPSEWVDDSSLRELPSVAVLPRLRGPELATVISLAVEIIGTTSGMVTLAVERHHLAALGEHIIDRIRRKRSRDDGDSATITLSAKGQKVEVPVTPATTGDTFAQALLQLADRIGGHPPSAPLGGTDH